MRHALSSPCTYRAEDSEFGHRITGFCSTHSYTSYFCEIFATCFVFELLTSGYVKTSSINNLVNENQSFYCLWHVSNVSVC